MPAHYSPQALKFLRSLARNNDREWFQARKEIYERELKAPTHALIEEVNQALTAFAPDHVRPAHKTMMRIYRDTRFDASRGQEPRPYKTQVAAWFGYNGPGPKIARTSGAGFYFHLSARELVIAAGSYMPGPEELQSIRRYLVRHHAELRRHLDNPKLQAVLQAFEGARLTRPPRGFAANTPGLDLIQCRQWGVSAQLPPETALDPVISKEIIRRFRVAAPVVHLLNAAVMSRGGASE